MLAGALAALLPALGVPAAARAAAPVVDGLTAVPAVVEPGGLVTVTVEAHDPDCSGTCTTGCGLYVRADLTAWSADGGVIESQSNGISASPYTASAGWRAPAAEATYTVTVSLSDSGTFLCGGRGTTTASVPIQVSLDSNAEPAVTSVTASPGAVYSGQQASLACAAADPDGDPVTFDWATDLGTVTEGPEAGGTAAATLVSERPGIATVTCTATDTAGAFGTGSVLVAVSDALAERALTRGLSVPHRLAVDDFGQVHVVDRSRTGIQVVDLFTGEPVHRLELPGVTSVAVDWGGDLLIGTVTGARVIDRSGRTLLVLDVEPGAGPVADVAVDPERQRYVTLHRTSSRVVVHDAAGRRLAAFGAVGDGPGEMLSPGGVAVAPGGEIVVADSGHGLVRVFEPLTGAPVRSFGGLGGGAGRFVRLDDVEVAPDGVVWASDSFQDWVQGFDPDGTPREVVGTFGGGLGELKTAAGVAVSGPFERLLAASVNSGSVQVFRTGATGTEPAPALEVTPAALDFGPRAVGTTSAPRHLAVSNRGTAPLGVRGAEATGDFAALGGCPELLDPGRSCRLEVVFAPTAAGARAGLLRLDTSDASANGGEPLEVPLSGTGFVPGAVVAAPGSLDFPDQPVGTVSEPLAVTLSNPGTAAVSLGRVSVSGPFGITHSCPAVLAGGGSCTVAVRFAPSTLGDHLAGELTVRGGGRSERVSLEGRGVGLRITPLPGALDFGPRRLAEPEVTRLISVTNTGSDLVQLAGATVVGVDPASFAVREDGCAGRTLWLGEGCTLVVAFDPAQGGELSAELELVGTAAPSRVDLRGFGVDTSVLEIPTLGEWGLLALGLLLALAGAAALGGRGMP